MSTPSYTIHDLLNGKVEAGQKVQVKAWVRTRRDSKGGFSFIELNDGSNFKGLQVVASGELSNYSTDILKLSTGCSVAVSGELVPSQGKGQSFEIHASQVEVLGWVEDPESYPVSKKGHTFEFLRTVAHLRPRTNTFGAVARLRHTLGQAIHRFFHEEGFFWVHTPLITTSDCEGGGALFKVSTLDLLNLPKNDKGQVDYTKDFFGKEAYLTVSGQLNGEAYASALGKIYTFGPTFRAENSNTSRHLAEFWMIEPEMAFATLKDDAKLAERLLKHIFQAVLNERQDDMNFFRDRVDKNCIERLELFLKEPFAQIEYTDAIRALEKSGKKFEFDVKWGIDLQTEHERWLCEEHVGRPVVVINYPKEIKSFYMRLNEDHRTVACMDVLAPGIGEIIGGSQREERLEVLDQRLAENGLAKQDYWWYRDLRRYGTVPHSGFGLGFERTVAYVSGLTNIRDCIPFPRAPGQADF